MTKEIIEKILHVGLWFVEYPITVLVLGIFTLIIWLIDFINE